MSPNAPAAARARIRRSFGLATATLTCFALAACSSASASPKATATPQAKNTNVPIVAVVRDSSDMTTVSLPIEQYLLTPAQNADINHAMWVLAAQCMRAHGMNFTVPAQLTGQRAGSEVARRYGPTDLDEASRYGYHNAPQPDMGTAGAPLISSLPAAERHVLTGTPDAGSSSEPSQSTGTSSVGGCQGEAMSELNGGQAPSGQGLASQIDVQSYQASFHSAQVIAVEQQWSACMAARGHHYSTPTDAFNDPTWRKSPTASRTEIATAVDDIQCKWQTNLIGVWVSVETRFQQNEIEQHQAELDLERGQNRQELTAAARAGH